MGKLTLIAKRDNQMVTVESTDYKNKMDFERDARQQGYQVVCVLNDTNIENIIKGEGKLVALLEKRNKKAVPYIKSIFGNTRTLSDYIGDLIEQGYISTTNKNLYEEIKKEAKEILEGTDSKLKFRYNIGKKIYEIKIV